MRDPSTTEQHDAITELLIERKLDGTHSPLLESIIDNAADNGAPSVPLTRTEADSAIRELWGLPQV